MEELQQNGIEKPKPKPKPDKGPKKKRVKMLRPSQINNKERQFIDLGGKIGRSIGLVELGSKIVITGRSFSGKSSFITELCKLFAAHTLVHYNSHEEKGGDAATMKKKLAHSGIDDSHDSNIKFYKAPIVCDIEETFTDILNKKGSAGFAVLDSVQHAQMGKKEYIEFTNRFCNARRKKTVAFISHWQKNDLLKHIWHDCDIKLEAMNYTVNVESRMEGATNEVIVIWEEGAKKAWGKNYNAVIKGNYWPGRRNKK